MWKYVVAFAILFGLALFIARQDERGAQEARKNATPLNKGAVSAEANKGHPQGNVENADWNPPSWYGFFRWPSGTTTWAIVLTLLAISEQSIQIARAARAAEESAKAARDSAGHLVKTERAWVLAELTWNEKVPHLYHREDKDGSKHTYVHVLLVCKNEGRSPAWVDRVYVRADALHGGDIMPYERNDCSNFGPLGPIGAGGISKNPFPLEVGGALEDGKFVSVYFIIDYRDVFGLPRETTLGYSITGDGEEMNRQNGLPGRNKNT